MRAEVHFVVEDSLRLRIDWSIGKTYAAVLPDPVLERADLC